MAVDFSALSSVAIASAIELAPQAVIHAVHVYDIQFEGRMFHAGVEDKVIAQYRDAAAAEATRMMEEFLRGLKLHGSILPIVRKGNPARLILDEANALQADLIVMGKHGRHGLEKFILGSVTEGVILNGLERDLLVVA